MSKENKFKASRSKINVFDALIRAKSRYGADKISIEDHEDKQFSYVDIIRSSFALGSALCRDTANKQSIAIMLPTSPAAVLTFFGLNAFGRVPAMINFTSGTSNIRKALSSVEAKHLVTSRAFVERGGLEALIEDLRDVVEIIYLEDVRANLSWKDKLAAAVGSIFPALIGRRSRPDETCVVLFTSGTEGSPKGVALSHTNIVANVQQILHHVPDVLTPEAVIFNPLPTFHCFGLTGGAIMPVIGGMKTVLYPSPLHAKEIPGRIEKSNANILMATDTFLVQYVRGGGGKQMSCLDFIVCGAERVKDETRQLVQKETGAVIIEGYGVTETSPVLAINKPESNRPGTVGSALVGMELMFEPVEGIKDAGRLMVRGPNVMKGYIYSDKPGFVQSPENGWHDTGDIVSIDEEGCLTIRGRQKRFAKLAGEMVSLTVVENCACALWPDFEHAAAVLPDKRKGEQIVLLTTNSEADRSDLAHWITNHGVSELSLPRRLFFVDEIPKLGTGKMDIGSIQKTAKKLLEEATQASSPS